MPEKTAIVFIDGNNLYHNLKGIRLKPCEIDLCKLSKAVCSHFGYEHIGSVYYNSTISIGDGKEKYFKHVRFLTEISKLPKFLVKTRKLQRHSTSEALRRQKQLLGSLDICGKCRPVIESECFSCIGTIEEKEKGIDVMIAVDMLNKCVLDDECDYCVLVSGDADFIPVSEIIRNRGKEMLSAFIPCGYSRELKEKLRHWVISPEFLVGNCARGRM